MFASRQERAVNRISTEQVLNKAYRLAYFLHQDKGTAMRIVVAATLKLNVAMAVQSKRLSYIPVGRFSRGELRRSDGIRNKALFSDLHLLQRLVYGESEPYERQKEHVAQPATPEVRANGDSASEEDLLVYFIKHLVRITTKRNAFYVTLGVSRLLHSYSTLETMELYNAVIGEPERVKDDYYYRSRKAVLMQEMYQRFGELIRACRQRRGEERFETQQGSSELRSLVRECLRLFTPWDTKCPVPRDFDPLNSVIAALTSNGRAEENEVEVSRIHAILHPDCFQSLVAAFGYEPPEERMELPRFFSEESNDQSPPRQRRAPDELNAEELAEINHLLDEQAGRRRRSPTAVIRIMVDGVLRATLNPAEQSSISFSVAEDAEIFEVKTNDAHGELLLATHLLTSLAEDARDAIVSSIRLEGGQDLSLTITRRQIESNGGADLFVTFGYRETDLRRVARLWWQRFNPASSPEQKPQYVLVATVVVICLLSYLAYVKFGSHETNGRAEVSNVQIDPINVSGNLVGKATEPGVAPGATPLPPPATADKPKSDSKIDRSTRNGSTAAQAQSAPRVNSTPDEDAAAEALRSGNTVAGVRLSEVKKIYIDIRADLFADKLHNVFADTLASSDVIAATTNADEADAALKIVVSEIIVDDLHPKPQMKATVRLVNARGTVLWPKAGRARYSGEVTEVVSQIIKDLTTEIGKQR
jgi:hypothetical protein